MAETLRDQPVLSDSEKAGVEMQEHTQHEQLTEEEMAIAKKLRTKIDIRIMPLVILVYLMNYIDRYTLLPHAF